MVTLWRGWADTNMAGITTNTPTVAAGCHGPGRAPGVAGALLTRMRGLSLVRRPMTRLRAQVSHWKVPGRGQQSKTGEQFQMRNQRADNRMPSVLLNGVPDRRGKAVGTAGRGLWVGQMRASATFLNGGAERRVPGLGKYAP